MAARKKTTKRLSSRKPPTVRMEALTAGLDHAIAWIHAVRDTLDLMDPKMKVRCPTDMVVGIREESRIFCPIRLCPNPVNPGFCTIESPMKPRIPRARRRRPATKKKSQRTPSR